MKEIVNECIACGTIGKKDNPLLTALKGTPAEFHVCTVCFNEAINNKGA
jgi:hypothetical protein